MILKVYQELDFLDVWISISGKYSYYWERRHNDGKIYRHDNVVSIGRGGNEKHQRD